MGAADYMEESDDEYSSLSDEEPLIDVGPELKRRRIDTPDRPCIDLDKTPDRQCIDLDP